MRFLPLIALCLFVSMPAQAATDCAVVLMHGKWGVPQGKVLKVLSERLSDICRVEKPEMPWSRNRNYDQAYDALLDDLARLTARLRQEGARNVFLAGHSFGANAAIAYQARIGDADGIVAIAPGHNPDYMYFRGKDAGFRPALDRAAAEVRAGRPATAITFNDHNTGKLKEFTLPAGILLSYFDPRGLAHMPASSAGFRKAVPLLYIDGARDRIAQGPEPIFRKAPAHPQSRFEVVEADHGSAPEAAAGLIAGWISDVMAR